MLGHEARHGLSSRRARLKNNNNVGAPTLFALGTCSGRTLDRQALPLLFQNRNPSRPV